MSSFATPFFPPEDCNGSQLVFVTFIYAYVLFVASDMISGGSELLLLVPSVAGLVGSVVLPVLGAVPDGMMVLFSGLGPDAQAQVTVGVGALAGSTIMLLTLPWFLAVWSGRVSLVKGVPQYKRPEDQGGKLDPPNDMSLTNTGVGVLPAIAKTAKTMMATSLIYLIIQIPAYQAEGEGLSTKEQSAHENTPALLALIVSTLAFFAYLYAMYKEANSSGGAQENKAVETMVNAIKDGKITLRGALVDFASRNRESVASMNKSLSQGLLDKDKDKDVLRLKKILAPFFAFFDVNGDNQIGFDEFTTLLNHLKEVLDKPDQQRLFALADTDKSGYICFEEFVACILRYLTDPDFAECTNKEGKTRTTMANYVESGDDDDEEEGEEEDLPEDLADLSPEEQQFRIKLRSCYMMGLGTLLVLIFSDPMVDVLSEIGVRTGISPFYIAFVLAPMASNASELVSAFNYAAKRTQKTMTISLSTLEGAACMNNTFCFGIFMCLVYFRGLAWQFTAETIVIVVVQLVIGCIAMTKSVQTLMDGYIILSLYPISLVFVWFLENKMGLD